MGFRFGEGGTGLLVFVLENVGGSSWLGWDAGGAGMYEFSGLQLALILICTSVVVQLLSLFGAFLSYSTVCYLSRATLV